jgi:hypothetical protein
MNPIAQTATRHERVYIEIKPADICWPLILANAARSIQSIIRAALEPAMRDEFDFGWRLLGLGPRSIGF